MKGIVVKAGPEIRWETRDFESPLHRSVGKTIGGFEIVHPRFFLEAPVVILCDDDALVNNPDPDWTEINHFASFCYGFLFDHDNLIVGDVVLMAEGMTAQGPDIIGLDDEQLKKLGDLLDMLKEA